MTKHFLHLAIVGAVILIWNHTIYGSHDKPASVLQTCKALMERWGRGVLQIGTLEIPPLKNDVIELADEPTVEGIYSDDPRIRQFFPPPHKDPSGFIIAGENSNEVIERITSLTGVPISVLDLRARPSSGFKSQHFYHSKSYPSSPDSNVTTTESMQWIADYGNFQAQAVVIKNIWGNLPHYQVPMRSSYAGLIESSQRLKDVLLQDNTWVLSYRLSHRQIAAPLLAAMAKLETSKNGIVEFVYNNRKYRMQGQMMGGSFKLSSIGENSKKGWSYLSGWTGFGVQGSCFNDNLFGEYSVTVVDLESGETLSIDALTPHLIFRYGFYQGGEYRVPPERIARFFRLV